MSPDEKASQGQPQSLWSAAWDYLASTGLAEPAIRLGTHALLVTSILIIAWGLREFYWFAQTTVQPAADTASSQLLSGNSQSLVSEAPARAQLPAFRAPANLRPGVSRNASLHTDLPSKTRNQVIFYAVQAGDSLFGIATRFGLRPETVLWANQSVLGDDPHSLRPGQTLQILPLDGIYHRWSAGDSLLVVASFFGVRPDDILNFPGNALNLATIGDLDSPDIPPGTWLMIPGGRREFVSWSAPDIPRDNPGVAKVLGPGACESVSDGIVGSGIFIWPTSNRFLSGFDFDPTINHYGIDIDGAEGDVVNAADGGVVVYAGWNNWGYGFMVVINHGNGWQTLYAHLNTIYVNCGQSVDQGMAIGLIGTSGNATEAHLHFEMMFNGVKVNPHHYSVP